MLQNTGYGDMTDLVFTVSHADFSIVDNNTPWSIQARSEERIQIKFAPTSSGNINGVLAFTNGEQSYQVSLFGVGTEAPKIAVSPENQVINNITIGDVVNAQITVENTGAYPLEYFIPGRDTKGISDNWPFEYHTYGYQFRSNYASDADPIAYEFQDISSTGVDITNQLLSDRVYAEVDMGFDFPYYGETKSKIYIAQKGFTTFDNSVRPLNDPALWGSRPAGYISVLGTVLKYIAQGKIFYQLEADRMIIQFDNVTNGLGSTATAQMVLYANGNIRFFYEEISLDPTYLNILIEDVAMKDGILLNGFRKDADIKLIELYGGLALGFDYPGPNIITSAENSSGVLSPGSSAVVNIELSTASMGEGITNKAITFISNDPFRPITKATIQLEVTDGGTPNAEISTDAIAFGNVFQGAVKSGKFTIKNSGSANIEVTSMTLADDEFVILGDIPATITPGSYKTYAVEIPTAALATLDDLLTITYAEGSAHEIHLTGIVVDAPAINVDLSLLQQTLEYGNDISIPFTLENTGLGTLEVTTSGKQWLSFETSTAASDINYTYEKHNTGGVYQWIDILKTGTHLPFLDLDDESTYWRTLTLPFPVEFYGEKYSSMKVGENGIISFEADPPTALNESHLPNKILTGPCVMPYWTFSGFRDSDYPKEEIGIFYQYYSDKIIITWSYFYNRFNMGDPVSAQIIFYKNGAMKFQYKPTEDGDDDTSRVSAIGLQRDINTGLIISDHLDLDHGQGLAYMVIPVKTHSIAPATTLSGELNLDAKNIYGGVYNEALKIQTNAPNNEQLEKPIELTVTGDAVVDMLAEVDFGKKMIVLNQWGDPEYYYVDLNIGNKGSALLNITWAQMAAGMQGLSFEIFRFSEGPWGGWFYSDISQIWGWDSPVITIAPGTSIKARAVFSPNAPGAFADEIVLTTNIGEIRVPLSGVGVEPPMMSVTTTSINVVMNTLSEKVNKSILFDNEEGLSDLTYQVSIDFGRATTARKTSEAISINSMQPSILRSTHAQASGNGARTQATYNRTLKHTPKESPDTFVGIGTAGTFRVATKYNAGAQGFNLSHVETWFRRAVLTTGTILVEIRAGGSSIADAALVAEGSLLFSGTDSDNAGSWHAIKLDKPAGIYPNEDFYVIITYPLGIDYPQGTVNNEPTIADRYYYFNFEKGEWSDIQKIATFETMGWLMFAAEETAGNSSWLTVTSPLSGTVAMGQGSSVELLIEGAYSQRGDQIANILIVSNDPKNDTVRVPVKLHMNEAPLFSNVPESMYVEEGKTLAVNVTVADKEGNKYNVAATHVYPWLTHTFANGVLVLTFNPDFGDAGNYDVVFTATDEHNAVRELTIPVEVAHTNRAPKFIGENESMTFNATGLLNQFQIEDFFSDPDGDAFTFTLANSNSSSVVTFASESEFLIRPIAVGESKLAFTVTDRHGAITKDTITVKVDIVLGAEEEFLNNGLGVYPNPTIDIANITLTNDWIGEVEIMVTDVNGKGYLTQQIDAGTNREIKVDVSKLTKGIYILRAVSTTKRATIKLMKK